MTDRTSELANEYRILMELVGVGEDRVAFKQLVALVERQEKLIEELDGRLLVLVDVVDGFIEVTNRLTERLILLEDREKAREEKAEIDKKKDMMRMRRK